MRECVFSPGRRSGPYCNIVLEMDGWMDGWMDGSYLYNRLFRVWNKIWYSRFPKVGHRCWQSKGCFFFSPPLFLSEVWVKSACLFLMFTFVFSTQMFSPDILVQDGYHKVCPFVFRSWNRWFGVRSIISHEIWKYSSIPIGKDSEMIWYGRIGCSWQRYWKWESCCFFMCCVSLDVLWVFPVKICRWLMTRLAMSKIWISL